jgi:hypothetical protein
MQTQHKVQLDERDNNPGLVRPPVAPYIAPGQQAMAAAPPPPPPVRAPAAPLWCCGAISCAGVQLFAGRACW